MSAVLWEDVLKHHLSHWPESRKALCNKILTVCFAMCCLASSFIMLFVGGSLLSIAASFLGAALGPLLGVFFLALLVPWANWKGALIGGVLSFIINMWMMFGQVITGAQTTRLPAPTSSCIPTDNTTMDMITTTSPTSFVATTTQSTDSEDFLDWMYSVSFMWYPLTGALLAMMFGIVFSVITGGLATRDLDPNLVAHYVRCGRFHEEYQEDFFSVDNKKLSENGPGRKDAYALSNETFSTHI